MDELVAAATSLAMVNTTAANLNGAQSEMLLGPRKQDGVASTTKSLVAGSLELSPVALISPISLGQRVQRAPLGNNVRSTAMLNFPRDQN
jgi:hypothetical protein